MFEYGVMIVLLRVCTASAEPMQAEQSASANANKSESDVRILADAPRVEEETLKLRYQIKNDSTHDIWLCRSMHALAWWHFEAYLEQDGETLLVQRRLDVPMEGSGQPPTGLYVRLPRGGIRSETMSFSLAIHHRLVLAGGRGPRPLVYARRLVLKIGYYDGDLPETVLSMLAEAEKSRPAEPLSDLYLAKSILGRLRGSLDFTVLNEDLRARDEQVVIPWTNGQLKGEKVLEVTIGDLRIPYSDEHYEPKPPDLMPCTRAEIRFRNSPLEFFFPYAQQQILLNEKERQYLQSLNVLEISDPSALQALAKEISAGMDDAFLVEPARADLICYSGNDRLISLIAYGDASVVTDEGQVFRFLEGIPTLRKLTPQLESLQLRVQCAANLKDLWHRLRLYGIAQYAPRNPKETVENLRRYGYEIPPSALRERKKAYPTARRWCDALVRGYRAVCGGDDIAVLKHRCPSAGEGKSHYAMNPNCGPDSTPDMVLLFETKAGWNQHGGPERFTFDNHDPRGGLVLLNDGTVKFIRTAEELKQLRWK